MFLCAVKIVTPVQQIVSIKLPSDPAYFSYNFFLFCVVTVEVQVEAWSRI